MHPQHAARVLYDLDTACRGAIWTLDKIKKRSMTSHILQITAQDAGMP